MDKICITKETKTLYRFLDLIKTIIKDHDIDYLLKFTGKSLEFYSNYAVARIKLSGGMEGLDNLLDIEKNFYKLRSTPLNEFELSLTEHINSALYTDIDKIMRKSQYAVNLNKLEPFKAAKIAIETGMLVSDNDVKMLNKFVEFDVYYAGRNYLIFLAHDREDTDIYTTTLIINPDMNNVSEQLSLDLNSKTEAEEKQDTEAKQVQEEIDSREETVIPEDVQRDDEHAEEEIDYDDYSYNEVFMPGME